MQVIKETYKVDRTCAAFWTSWFYNFLEKWLFPTPRSPTPDLESDSTPIVITTDCVNAWVNLVSPWWPGNVEIRFETIEFDCVEKLHFEIFSVFRASFQNLIVIRQSLGDSTVDRQSLSEKDRNPKKCFFRFTFKSFLSYN